VSEAPLKNPAMLHAQALGHFRAGKMPEGIILLEKALELNPGSGEMHSHMGIARFETEDVKTAGRHFDISVRLEPKNFMVQNDCGIFLLKTNRPKDAERHFRKALAINPVHAEATLNLGRSLQRQGRLDEAAHFYIGAVRLNPRLPDALYNIGALYLRGDLPEQETEGRQYLEKALALDPQHENAWIALIRSHERAGDHAGEEQALLRAEKQLPHSLELAVIRMTVLLRQDRMTDIPRRLKEAAQKLGRIPAAANPAMLRDMAKIYDRLGDPAGAFPWFSLASAAQKRVYAEQAISRDAYPKMIDGYRKSLSPVKGGGPRRPCRPMRRARFFWWDFPAPAPLSLTRCSPVIRT
jgi:Tfp pilus assembly protein PilF